MRVVLRSVRAAAGLTIILAVAASVPWAFSAAPPPPAPVDGSKPPATEIDRDRLRGAAVYRDRCQGCHEGQAPKAPSHNFLQMVTPEAIYQALSVGVMRTQATGLSDSDERAVAEYLSDKALGAGAAREAPICVGAAGRFDVSRAPDLLGWGFTPRNDHFVPAEIAGLSAVDIPRLKVKWAFAYPDAVRARSRPTFAYGALYVGSQAGKVYALDAKTGCIRWSFQTTAEVRTAVLVGADASGKRAYFGDLLGRIYALDALSGREIWRRKIDDHPSVTITGTPVLQGQMLFVPVSSLEEGAVSPKYPCCTFRGSVVALVASSGQIQWKRYMIDQAPRARGVTAAGTPIFSPSGAAIWNSPTIDARRGRLYVGTGNNYTGPPGERSNAVVALELKTGHIAWTHQVAAGDAWNVGCMVGYASCPPHPGPDSDIGSGTMLIRLADGRDRILAGLKNGVVIALDPDRKGRLVWSNRVGHGSIQGGVQFGMAYDGKRLYVPISDMVYPAGASTKIDPAAGSERPGLYALDAENGKFIWRQPAVDTCAKRPDCNSGILASIASVPGAVFAGHMDGQIRAYDSDSGRILWAFDTLLPQAALGGGPSRGGSIGGGGPVVHDGMLYTNSGYGLYAHMPGNLLIAFSVDGR